MTKHEWTTPNGAKVEITVSQEHIELIDVDGDKVETTKKELRLESLKVNGAEYDGKINGKMVTFKLNGRNAGANIPENIHKVIIQPTLDRWEEERKASAEYQKHHDAVNKIMSY